MSSSLSNAEELLLLCAGKDLSSPRQKRAAALIKEGIDWDYFFELARMGRVIILAYDALIKITPFAQIPQFILDRLKPAYLLIVQKTTYQYNYLLDLLELFAEKKIPVIPLKGAFLAKRVYGDIAARSLSVDGDLLVEEKNIEPAQALLEKAGYSFSDEDSIIRPWQKTFRKSKAMPIELHWDITKMGRSKERIEAFWRGARLAEEDGVGYYEFREEELLLYHSAQTFNDCSFVQLRYACDIDRLLYKCKESLDWSKITEMAKRWKLSNSLYAALSLSKKLFNSEVPAGALKRIRPDPFKIAFLNFFVNKKVIMGNGLRRRFIDNILRAIFFEIIEAVSAGDYFSILFPSKEARDKSWAARLSMGASALSGMFPEKRKTDNYSPTETE